MTRLKRQHEHATTHFTNVSKETDREIAAALLAIYRNPLAGRPRSLKKLVRDLLDSAIASWLNRNADSSVSWQFSELIDSSTDCGLKELTSLAREHRRRHSFPLSDTFAHTCDSLIEFTHFYRCHSSDHVKVIQIGTPRGKSIYDQDNVRLGKGVKLGARAKEKLPKIPWYLQLTRLELVKQELCVACGNPTRVKRERIRVIDQDLSDIDRENGFGELMESGEQYSSDFRGSLTYCPDHAEGEVDSAAAKRARKTSPHFLSLLYVLSYSEISPQLNPLFAPEFDLEFSRQTISSKSGAAICRTIYADVARLHGDSEAEKQAAKEKLVEQIRHIFFDVLKLQRAP